MKKNFFITLLLLFSILGANAQTNLVPNGDFETWNSSGNPTSWSRLFSGYWLQSSDFQNGASSANMVISSGTLNYIFTPSLAVTANKTYKVTMYFKSKSGTFTNVDLRLYHTPSVFPELLIKQASTTFSTTQWQKIEFNYTSLATENIALQIWTNGALDSEMLVDNVSLVEQPGLGVEDFKNSTIKLVANHYLNKITFNNAKDLSNVVIYTVDGKQVINSSFNDFSDQKEIDLSTINKGIYIAKFSENGKTYTQKFIR
jgi:Secretion system C-terminal sorting domain